MKEEFSKTDTIKILHDSVENLRESVDSKVKNLRMEIREEIKATDSGIFRLSEDMAEVKTILKTTTTCIDKLVIAVDDRNEKLWKKVGYFDRWKTKVTAWAAVMTAVLGSVLLFFKDQIAGAVKITFGH